MTPAEPRVHPRQVRRALRKSTLIDSFLCCRFSFSPYMACAHGCRYCDGRAEKYWVEGDFERDIVVRQNLPELLRTELAGLRERAPIGIGSGITDSYQPLERTTGLTRECAAVLAEHHVPVRLLTKSALAARDLDIWSRVNAASSFILYMSIGTLDEGVRSRFEPGASTIAERIETLRAFRGAGIPVGVMAIPLLPFISDGVEDIRALVRALKDAGASFVMPGGLTLRPGRQKDFFMREIQQEYPGLVDRYRDVYAEERESGAATRAYRDGLAARIRSATAELGVPTLLPHALYCGSVPLYDEVHLLLQHMTELYGGRGVATGRLKDACGRYAGWLLARKKTFNRRSSMVQEDLEEETRALFSTGAASTVLGNGKLAGFLGDVVLKRRVMDYVTLTLNDGAGKDHDMSARHDQSLSVILRKPFDVVVEKIPVPPVGEPSVEVELGACGICGSDVRYYAGENPWALHTLGRRIPSPPNMVLGHEVSGTVREGGTIRRVAILAYKACGKCRECRSGNENRCDDMEHFGHSAGWGTLPFFPGGMAHHFRIWKGFDYDIPPSISFEEATFLDGLAVAVHAVSQCGITAQDRLGVLGLGPIGLLAAQAARARGVEVCGCDVAELPVRLARETGFDTAVIGDTAELLTAVRARGEAGRLSAVIDTVGTQESIQDGMAMLAKGGVLVLLAVHDAPVSISPIALASERRLVTSSNNRYSEFPAAIELLASGAVKVRHLVTHRFPLLQAPAAFEMLLKSGRTSAYKVVLLP